MFRADIAFPVVAPCILSDQAYSNRSNSCKCKGKCNLNRVEGFDQPRLKMHILGLSASSARPPIWRVLYSVSKQSLYPKLSQTYSFTYN